MKFVIMALAFVGSIANAEVKQQGEFVPRFCSFGENQVAGSNVKSVCLGELAQMDQSAIEVTTADGDSRVYAIEMEKKAGGMGVTKRKFSGNLHLIRMHDPIEGVFAVTSGMTVSYQIALKTMSGKAFKGNLQTVFTTL